VQRIALLRGERLQMGLEPGELIGRQFLQNQVARSALD
jgi:hypothetical protein